MRTKTIKEMKMKIMSKKTSDSLRDAQRGSELFFLPPTHAADVDLVHAARTADHNKENELNDIRRAELSMAYGQDGGGVKVDKPFAFVSGLAIIPVHGMLVHRFNQSWGWVTGYTYIQNMVGAAVRDGDVKAIVLDISSAGGQVVGCFETVDFIREMGEVKPIHAVVDTHAYSAAYAIASAAQSLSVAPSAGVGSIGVINTHVSFKRMLDNSGVDVTMTYAGSHKADGNPYESLPDNVKASIKDRVDKLYVKFVDLVAGNRNISVEAVKSTEADVYDAEDGLKIGLIDRIETASSSVSRILGSQTNQGQDMTITGSKKATSSEAKTTEDKVTEVSATQTANQEQAPSVDLSAAKAEARQEERQRISSIMGCEEAKGRESLANHLATNTDLGVDEAKGILAVSPSQSESSKQEPKATVNHFQNAMDQSANPEVGGDTDSTSAEGDNVSSLLSAHSAATGVQYK